MCIILSVVTLYKERRRQRHVHNFIWTVDDTIQSENVPNITALPFMQKLPSFWFTVTYRNTNNSLTISLTKRQVVVTHTIRQKVIPALLDSWVTNKPSVKMLCPQKKNCFSLYSHKNITRINVGLLMIGHVLYVCCKSANRWIMTSCCCMSDRWWRNSMHTIHDRLQQTAKYFVGECMSLITWR